jgi:hypothetical protein
LYPELSKRVGRQNMPTKMNRLARNVILMAIQRLCDSIPLDWKRGDKNGQERNGPDAVCMFLTATLRSKEGERQVAGVIQRIEGDHGYAG